MTLVRNYSIRSVDGLRRSCIAAINFSSYVPKLKAKTEGADPPVTISRKARLACHSKRPQPLPRTGPIADWKTITKPLKAPSSQNWTTLLDTLEIFDSIGPLNKVGSTGQQSKSKMPTTSAKPISLLPAKTYVPPSGLKPLRPIQPLIDRPVGDQVMPTDEMVQATATKRRRSSANTKYAFLPLPVVEE